VKPSRVILFWVVVIALLLFTLPVQSAVGNLVSFVFALVFTTILALIGAIFIGIYISHRFLTPTGFTPFEEEMLRMRADVAHLRDDVEALKSSIGPVAGEPKERGP